MVFIPVSAAVRVLNTLPVANNDSSGGGRLCPRWCISSWRCLALQPIRPLKGGLRVKRCENCEDETCDNLGAHFHSPDGPPKRIPHSSSLVIIESRLCATEGSNFSVGRKSAIA